MLFIMQIRITEATRQPKARTCSSAAMQSASFSMAGGPAKESKKDSQKNLMVGQRQQCLESRSAGIFSIEYGGYLRCACCSEDCVRPFNPTDIGDRHIRLLELLQWQPICGVGNALTRKIDDHPLAIISDKDGGDR